MKTITTKALKRLEKKGKVRRESPEPEQPKEEVTNHASMAASMDSYEEGQKALRILTAKNAEAISELGDQISNLGTREVVVQAEDREPSPYTFDIERDDDKLLKRVYARPGIIKD